MNDKPRKPLSEQFRTLDDRDESPVAELREIGRTDTGRVEAVPAMPPIAGYWRLPELRRPNAWRRFWAWCLLGWRWSDRG